MDCWKGGTRRQTSQTPKHLCRARGFPSWVHGMVPLRQPLGHCHAGGLLEASDKGSSSSSSSSSNELHRADSEVTVG